MRQYKRAVFSFFSIEEDELVDIASLLRGEYRTSTATKLFALSPLSASKHPIAPQDIDLLLRIPADRWMPEEKLVEMGAEPQELEHLARQGLLVCDGGDSNLVELKRRADVLVSEEWHPYAALYHFMTRESEKKWVGMPSVPGDTGLEEGVAERARQFVKRHGPSPKPFNQLSGSSRFDLPIVEKSTELYQVLKRRKTARAFDSDVDISLEDFSTLLHYVFGCHGYTRLAPEVLLLHRTSPSGGSRHPIEAYALVLQVESVATGLYHYDMKDHALELVKEYGLDEARALAVDFAGGQDYVGSAHVLFIMTARYFRNYWKYRRRSRSYSVVLLDAAHLSQSLYLVATQLKLGAFFSAAINGPRIEEVLGIDGYEEGAVAVCGCGVEPGADQADLSLEFRSFIPRKTEL